MLKERIAFVGGPNNDEETEVPEAPNGFLVLEPRGMYLPLTPSYQSWDEGQASLQLFGTHFSRRDDGTLIYTWNPWSSNGQDG